MKVTIGVPVYNVENYIERCAISIFEQTYSNVEIVFVDDCSPDNSVEKILNLLKDYPDKRKIVKIIKHEKNCGLAAVRNTVISHASGDFVIHVDSDDYIDRSLIEKCVKKQKEGDFDIVLFDYYSQKENGLFLCRHCRATSIRERTLQLLSRKTTVCIWGGMYRLSLYKDHNIRCVEGVNNNEDYQITPKLSYYSKSFAYISEPLYFYNCTNLSSITSKFKVEHAEQGWKSIYILKSFFEDKGEEFTAAIDVATINRLANYIKGAVIIKDKKYFDKMQIRLKETNKDEISTVPLQRRPYLWIGSYPILQLYTYIGQSIKGLRLVFSFNR